MGGMSGYIGGVSNYFGAPIREMRCVIDVSDLQALASGVTEYSKVIAAVGDLPKGPCAYIYITDPLGAVLFNSPIPRSDLFVDVGTDDIGGDFLDGGNIAVSVGFARFTGENGPPGLFMVGFPAPLLGNYDLRVKFTAGGDDLNRFTAGHVEIVVGFYEGS